MALIAHLNTFIVVTDNLAVTSIDFSDLTMEFTNLLQEFLNPRTENLLGFQTIIVENFDETSFLTKRVFDILENMDEILIKFNRETGGMYSNTRSDGEAQNDFYAFIDFTRLPEDMPK